MSEYTPDSISENEPSMEDILASIRKIIADDTPTSNAGLAHELGAAKPAADFATDPLDLTETNSLSSKTGALDALDFDLETEGDVLDLTESLIDVPADTARPTGVTDFDEDFDLVLGEDGNDDGLDVEALFNGDDEATLKTQSAAIVSDEDILDLDALLDSDFDETEFDLDIPSEPERVFDPAEALLANDESDVTGDVAANLSDHDLIEDMLGDMELGDSDDSDLGLPATDAILGAGVTAATAASMTGDADIDLVKSLMAELTEDEDFEVDASAADDADLIIPELDDIDAVEASELSDEIDLEDLLSDADEDDALSDVTGIAATRAEPIAEIDESSESVSDDLADIVAQSNADIEAAKLNAETLDAQSFDKQTLEAESITPLSIYDDAPEAAPVDAADDDAHSETDITEDMLMPNAPEPEMETDNGQSDDSDSGLAAFAAAAAAGGAAIVTGASLSGAPDEDEVLDLSDIIPDLEDEAQEEVPLDPAAQSETDTHTETLQNTTDLTEDTDMPRIVKSDTIAADETVEAASGAFASLSQVVEEKAVFNESGPRIGDLVQEALKPMLQDWLDKNLKGIVDRAVAKEIKRISSGK